MADTTTFDDDALRFADVQSAEHAPSLTDDIEIAALALPLERRQQERPEAESERSFPLSAAQVRGARGMLDWTARELAERSGVSFSTVRRIEAPGRRVVSADTLRAVRAAFEKHGVEFVELGDGRQGLVSKP